MLPEGYAMLPGSLPVLVNTSSILMLFHDCWGAEVRSCDLSLRKATTCLYWALLCCRSLDTY